MQIFSIYFSPTGGTKKVMEALEKGFAGEVQEIDICVAGKGESREFSEKDLCLVGVPSYGGRVPAAALNKMAEWKGNGAKAVPVIVYGNRAYEDTMKELEDFLEERGFICAAGIAAVAEHSIVRRCASGRPDAEDRKELAEYAEKIWKKVTEDSLCGKPELPGKRPYKDFKGVALKPESGKECNSCGLCAELCPVGAIPVDNPGETDKERCISCMRCVAVCPSHARTLDREMTAATEQKLEKVCAQRKENELFL